MSDFDYEALWNNLWHKFFTVLEDMKKAGTFLGDLHQTAAQLRDAALATLKEVNEPRTT